MRETVDTPIIPDKMSIPNVMTTMINESLANGCLNLECELRFCCQRLKNWVKCELISNLSSGDMWWGMILREIKYLS